jgi:acetylornithine deacetylase/succinyl-diaminopimelate desuccinylase-like protein
VTCDGGNTFSLNVIPTTAEAGFDVRISPNLATADFRRLLDRRALPASCLPLSRLELP